MPLIVVEPAGTTHTAMAIGEAIGGRPLVLTATKDTEADRTAAYFTFMVRSRDPMLVDGKAADLVTEYLKHYDNLVVVAGSTVARQIADAHPCTYYKRDGSVLAS